MMSPTQPVIPIIMCERVYPPPLEQFRPSILTLATHYKICTTDQRTIWGITRPTNPKSAIQTAQAVKL